MIGRLWLDLQGTGAAQSGAVTNVWLFHSNHDAIDVFNTLTWYAEGGDKNIDKVLEKFEEYCEPRKNLFSWALESGETIDQYVTVLRKLS